MKRQRYRTNKVQAREKMRSYSRSQPKGANMEPKFGGRGRFCGD